MASIKKRDNGSYLIRVYLGDDLNGKKIFKNTTYRPRATTPKAAEKEVQQYAADYERKVLNGDLLSGDEMTVNDFFKVWLTDYAPKQLTPHLVEEYEITIKRVFLPVIGCKRIAAVNPVILQSIVTDLEKKGLQPATIRRYFDCISSMLTRAFKAGIIKENPCKRLLLPRIERDPNDIKYFDREQAITFLNALEKAYTIHHEEKTRKNGRVIPAYDETISISLQFRALFTLAVFSGARRGELLALTWNDIDFRKGLISISKATAAMKKTGQFIKAPKTKAGIRTFSVPMICIDVLKEWKAEQMNHAAEMGDAWQGLTGDQYDDNFIFIQDNGKQMDLFTPTHKFKEIISYFNASVSDPKDRLPEITFHDLRHTSASLMIASGFIDIETIARRLGHSDVSMTLNRYGHALPSQDEKAVLALESMLTPTQAAAPDIIPVSVPISNPKETDNPAILN